MAALLISQVIRLFAADKNASNHITNESFHTRSGAIPVLASPVDPEAYAWLRRKRRNANANLDDEAVPGKIKRSFTVAQFEEEHGDKESELAGRIFRKQHAASSLELFFDLFFVANLAVFTTNSEHFTTSSRFMCFFTSSPLTKHSNPQLHRLLLHFMVDMVPHIYTRCSFLR